MNSLSIESSMLSRVVICLSSWFFKASLDSLPYFTVTQEILDFAVDNSVLKLSKVFHLSFSQLPGFEFQVKAAETIDIFDQTLPGLSALPYASWGVDPTSSKFSISKAHLYLSFPSIFIHSHLIAILLSFEMSTFKHSSKLKNRSGLTSPELPIQN